MINYDLQKFAETDNADVRADNLKPIARQCRHLLGVEPRVFKTSVARIMGVRPGALSRAFVAELNRVIRDLY